MTPVDSLAFIPDDELFATVQRLTARSNVALAELLVHLGEVERRGIHRQRACASLYTYCIYELRMSEDAAFRRSRAARLVREYPELRDAIAKGEIHLTGVLIIGPHLGGDRHAEILRRARFRSKRELTRLVAEIDPKPEVLALVEPIGPAPLGAATHEVFVEALAGPVRDLSPGRRPEDWMATNDDDASHDDTCSELPDETEPQRPLQYKVQFTACQEFVDLLDEVRDLLGHDSSRPALPEIQLRALRALVKELRGRRRAATKRPVAGDDVESAAPSGTAPARDSSSTEPAPARESSSRYIPARTRRAVFDRDSARCAYHDNRGERCRETCGLEIHHRHAHALGGPPTLDNLEVRCRAHNTLAAEEDFGRTHMDRMRGVMDDAAPEREFGRPFL
jgi:5-methylcytosine-specific restriction endonuclease McrA